MKAMSIILKILSVLGFVSAVHNFLSGDIESSILSLAMAIFILAIGVLFRNLAEAFEDIRLMRERQKLELISKGIIDKE